MLCVVHLFPMQWLKLLGERVFLFVSFCLDLEAYSESSSAQSPGEFSFQAPPMDPEEGSEVKVARKPSLPRFLRHVLGVGVTLWSDPQDQTEAAFCGTWPKSNPCLAPPHPAFWWCHPLMCQSPLGLS